MLWNEKRQSIIGGESMERNVTSLTLKIPPGVHKKLKIIAAISGKTMTEEIISLIESVEMKMPTFSLEDKKSIKKESRLLPDKAEIMKMVLSWKGEGMTYQAIAERLESEGYGTLSGRGSWVKGTVANMFRDSKPKDADSTPIEEKE